MKIRNLLIVGSLMMAALPSIGADYPEKLYLVGTMNNWTLPAYGNLIEVPAVEDGVYSVKMDIKAPDYEAPISFKIFNTLSDNWMDPDQYYGAMVPDNYCAIYKDAPASWKLAPGYGSNDMQLPNVTSLKDAVVTINLKENKASISSESAPLAPQEVCLADGGEDGVKYPLQREGETSVFKGSVTLGPGTSRLAFTGDNGFLLGADNTVHYLWKDRPANFIMIMNRHDSPFIMNNWMGGKLDVSVNITNGFVSFNAPEQPSFPETINLVMKVKNGEDVKFPITSHETEYGDLAFSYYIQDWQKDVRFTIEVPGIGTLYTDSDPIELVRNDNSYVSLDTEYKNYIEISNWEGGDLGVFVPENFTYLSLYSPTQPLPKQALYLIGSPQGWNINDGTMELTQIDNSKFAGEFDMPADPMFRFYTELGNWDIGSIGSQMDDAPIDVVLEGDKELNVGMTYGKGPWNFTGFPGGKMYMVVDLRSLTATFSTLPISEIKTIGYENMKLNVVAGGIE
ncbi:MAG: hypothetical protein K2H76_02165, partial [Muribaculaceae bacterium]|nr:hypothetical protein [Muribaculaceae bacterium]